MRKLVYFMHASLDGFVATEKGELNWVKIDDALFDFVGQLTQAADTALYGRVTYDMMESYWPHAAEKPNATKHDKEHAVWYNQVPKVVLSRTLSGREIPNTTVISADIPENIMRIKNKPGKNILIFGSPSASHTLLGMGLIDSFWIFVNPVLLGAGIPLFSGITEKIPLTLMETKTFASGVVALHYEALRA